MTAPTKTAVTLYHVTPTGQVRPCPSSTCLRVVTAMERYYETGDFPKNPAMSDALWACGMDEQTAIETSKTLRRDRAIEADP